MSSFSIKSKKILFMIIILVSILGIEGETRILTLQRKDARTYFEQGKADFKQGNYDSAIEYYTKAIALDPNYAAAYNGRGLSNTKKGALNSAVQDYTRAIDILPDSPVPFYNRGLVYLDLQKHQLAVDDFTRAIQLDPKNVNAYGWRGIAYQKLGLYDKAIEDFSNAIDISTGYAWAYVGRGEAYLKKNQYELAVADLKRAAELDPSNKNFSEKLESALKDIPDDIKYQKLVDSLKEAGWEVSSPTPAIILKDAYLAAPDLPEKPLSVASKGQAYIMVLDYAISGAPPERPIDFVAWWKISIQGAVRIEYEESERKANGQYLAIKEIKLPQAATLGDYVLTGVIRMNGKEYSKIFKFTIR